MRGYKVIAKDKRTNKITTIVEHEDFIELARMIAKENKTEYNEVKIYTIATNKEIDIEPKQKKEFERDYKNGYKICRNNFVKLY